MYVNIGPYPRRFNPLDWYDYWLKFRYNAKSWNIDESKLTFFDRIIEKICDKLQDIANSTINSWYFDKRKRKEEVKVHQYDAWSADNTIAIIVLPILKELERQGFGIPRTDPEDAPDIGLGEPTQDGYSDTKAEARWNWILGEMIYAFEAAAYECEWEDQFYKTYTHTMSIKERTEYDLAWDRRRNGLRLFGKYFHSLWN